jgi:hypothetical protein
VEWGWVGDGGWYSGVGAYENMLKVEMQVGFLQKNRWTCYERHYVELTHGD